MSATVCLNMIVKDEAHIIERCLASVKSYIDYWVIVDTGSSDDTSAIVERYLADIPGELHHRSWKDFGTNRTEALNIAKGKTDYLLFLDADEEFLVDETFAWGVLDADRYDVLHTQGSSFSFWRTTLVRNRLAWRWVGVLHEYLLCEGDPLIEKLGGARIHGHFDGGRSQVDVLEKYALDAATLEKALFDEPDNARYTFYLAQSYRDSGQLEKAMEQYLRRSKMNDWDEETWYSLLQVALLSERLGLPECEVIDNYLQSYDFRPKRSEPLVNLARYLRERRRFGSARVFAAQAVELPKPDDLLFIDESCYSWRSLDELAIADYWTGNVVESAQICEHLLASPGLPAEERARVTQNLNFAIGQLGPRLSTAPA